MIRELEPANKLNVRLVILAVMLVPLVVVPGIPLWSRILGCIMPLIFTGTYRISKIIETRFETRFHFAFIPFPLQKCKLATVGTIETTYANTQPGLWTIIIFGPLQFVCGWIFDYLLPSLGGPLEIWLVT